MLVLLLRILFYYFMQNSLKTCIFLTWRLFFGILILYVFLYKKAIMNGSLKCQIHHTQSYVNAPFFYIIREKTTLPLSCVQNVRLFFFCTQSITYNIPDCITAPRPQVRGWGDGGTRGGGP